MLLVRERSTRFVLTIPLAALCAFGLFYVMHLLVLMTDPGIDEPAPPVPIGWMRVIEDSPPERTLIRPPPPVTLDPPPPIPRHLPEVTDPSDRIALDPFDAGESVDDDIHLSQDGEAVPLVRVPPEYPMRAEQRGLEGWVTIEFSISPTGSVIDPLVIDSTSSVFHQAALNAIRKWKYSPRIVDGKAVKQTRMQVTLDFGFAES